MERSLLTLIFKFLGIVFYISHLLVYSLAQNTTQLISDSSPIVPPSPLPSSPPPSSTSATIRPPPEKKTDNFHSPPPPRKIFLRHPKNFTGRPPHSHQITHPANRGRRNHQTRKASDQRSSLGKKIGFLFAAIAAILQIPVIGFLVYKRKQISKIKDKGDTS